MLGGKSVGPVVTEVGRDVIVVKRLASPRVVWQESGRRGRVEVKVRRRGLEVGCCAEEDEVEVKSLLGEQLPSLSGVLIRGFTSKQRATEKGGDRAAPPRLTRSSEKRAALAACSPTILLRALR